MLNSFKVFIIIFNITFILYLLIDFFLGNKILKMILLNDREIFETQYRVNHKIFHHSLKENFNGVGWWHKKYQVCTDEMGFKVSCAVHNESNKKIEKDELINSSAKKKYFDIVFIGDSMTEGVGLSYEDSFVGKISAFLNDKKIANLGVAGYSTSNYLSKINFFIDKIEFKELIVFMDPSDVYDERITYFTKTKKINYIVINSLDNKYLHFIKDKIEIFPILKFTLIKIRRFFLKLEYVNNIELEDYLSKDFNITEWTFEGRNLSQKQKVPYEPLIIKSIQNMDLLYNILKNKNISLSIAVYPHPAQIYNNNLFSKNEKIWEDFCKKKCKKFYNLSHSFEYVDIENAKKIINEYYIIGDVHFNEKGSSLIAKSFLNLYNKK